MMRKKKPDRPALSFADSSIQGRSADAENERGEDIIDDDPAPRRTRSKKLFPPWMTAATIAGSSDDKGQGDDSSEDTFVALPPSRRSGRKKGTGNQKEDQEWQPEEDNDVLLLEDDDDDEEIEADDDDDFEPSTSRAVKKPKLNQRKHLQLKRERERLKQEKKKQEEEDRLRQAENEELERALELSRIEMEEQARLRKQEDDFLAGLDIVESNNSSPTSGPAENSQRSVKRNGIEDDGEVADSSVTEDSEPENIGNKVQIVRPVQHHSSQKMVRPEQSVYEWQDHQDEEESTQVTRGNAVARNNQSPSMFSTPASADGSQSHQSNGEMPSSTSGAAASGKPKEGKQETIDKALGRATRLSLRKRPLEDHNQTSCQPRKIARAVVPHPPKISTLDDLISDNEEEGIVIKNKKKTEDGWLQTDKVKGQNESDAEQEFLKTLEPGDIDEGIPLVDTRNQPDKPSYYAPKGACFKNYTKVILKLLRHYCLRLRKSQATSALRVEWGSPVVPGPLFTGTLCYKKRGMKPPVPLYSLSDDDTPSHASDGEWKTAVKPTKRSGVKDFQGTRKRKRGNAISDSDSDLEEFDIGNAAKKAQRTSKMKELKQADKKEDSDIDVISINENVPILKIECVATIGDGSKDIDDKDIPGGNTSIDENAGGSGGMNNVGVSSGTNGDDEDDASQTLAYDAYNADTEEFVAGGRQQNIPSVNEAEEASTSVQQEICKEEEKGPSTSSVSVAESRKNEVEKEPSTSTASIAASRKIEGKRGHSTSSTAVAASRKDQTEKGDSTSSSSVATTLTKLKDTASNQVETQVSVKVENIENRSEEVTEQCVRLEEDPCLVDSTTISVLRKSRQPKKKGSSQNSQSSQNSNQGAVSSSEAQETVSDDQITDQNKQKVSADLSNSKTMTNSKESNVAQAVEESASTSETNSVALRTTKDSDNTDVETTSNSSKQQPQRGSPIDNVSSMPKTVPSGASLQHADPEAGVSSSKEATPQKMPRSSKVGFKEKFPDQSFEEVRFKFVIKMDKNGTLGASEARVSANSSTNTNKDTSNEYVSEDLEKAVQEACSDVLIGSKSEGVSSSFSVRTKSKHVKEKAPVNQTMQKETTEVASTSDNPECETVEPSKSNLSASKVCERPKRHQSPGVASSSDDQKNSPRQRTVNSDQEAESSSSSAAAIAATAVASRTSAGHQGREAVESSGLESDASGVAIRPRRFKAGAERVLGIGSSDEATTSEENGWSKLKVDHRQGEEASTSADFQPVNNEPTKGREAQAVPKKEESIARGSRTSQAADVRLSQPTEDGDAGRPDEAVSSNDNDVQENAVISVECPLCGVQFPLQQIEAHASECEGPQEQEVAEVPVQTRPKQARLNMVVQQNQQEDDEEAEDVANNDDDVQPQHSEGFPNSSWNAEWFGREESSRKKPVHTYSRVPKTAMTGQPADDSEDEWLTPGEDHPRPSRTQRGPKRNIPNKREEEDDDEGNTTPELDHVEATIYQMAANNELQLVEPRIGRSTRAGKIGRNVQRSPSIEDEEEEEEEFEKCFLCNKLIRKSEYAAHVNEEVDRMQNDDSAEGAASGEVLQAGTGLVRRSRRTEASNKTGDQQNTADSSKPEIIVDDSSDDDEQPFDPANISFGDSPIRAYKKISDQPTNLIDFKNQFKTSKPGVSLFNGKSRGRNKAYRGKRGRGKGKRRR